MQKMKMAVAASCFGLAALAFPQTSSAGAISFATAGTSSCATQAVSPNDEGISQYTCSLYNDTASYTIDLTPVLTQGGANFYDNVVGAGYLVVMNGDPSAVSNFDANDAALYNEGLWVAVLYWPGDQDASSASESLTVYWPTTFPTASVVQTFDEDLYGSIYPDSAFFVESTPPETVYAPDSGHVYDIFTTRIPEPATLALFGAGLGLLGFARRRRAK
jgi:hypothetical protein